MTMIIVGGFLKNRECRGSIPRGLRRAIYLDLLDVAYDDQTAKIGRRNRLRNQCKVMDWEFDSL